jgi:hypothetical protein
MPRATPVAACALALTSCSSLPSRDQFTQPNAPTLTLNSAPPGAEARLSTGGNCRTPCMLPVSAADDFTVTYALDGYVSQTIPVRLIPAVKSALIDLTPSSLDPNQCLSHSNRHDHHRRRSRHLSKGGSANNSLRSLRRRHQCYLGRRSASEASNRVTAASG